MTKEIGTLCCAKTREHEAEEGEASEGAENRFVVEVGYERCGKEKDDVEHKAHDDVEPEHGIVLLVRRLAFVGKSGSETALLQHAGNVGENDQGGHLAVVVGR